MIISPLLNGSRVGLEAAGWWDARALMVLPTPPSRIGSRERLSWGDGAGEGQKRSLVRQKWERTSSEASGEDVCETETLKVVVEMEAGEG